MFGKNKKTEFDDFSRVLMCNIKNGSVNHKSAQRLTQVARRLSNRANFIMRKDLFTDRKPNQSKVDKLLKKGTLKPEDKDLYRRLPAAVSQRTIQIVGDNWSSFASAKSDWKKSPDKYQAAPKRCIYHVALFVSLRIILSLQKSLTLSLFLWRKASSPISPTTQKHQ